MYMNKELKELVEQASFDYANGCHGLCDRMKAIKEKKGRWPSMDGVCPCELCKNQCKGYNEALDHANGAELLYGLVGEELLGQYVCRLIKERIE